MGDPTPPPRRLSKTRSPPRERRDTLKLSSKNAKLLDDSFTEPFLEKEMQARPKDLPAFQRSLAPTKPALRNPRVKKTAMGKKSKLRKSVSFSSEIGTAPAPQLDDDNEEEATPEETNPETSESTTGKDDSDSKDNSEASTGSKEDSETKEEIPVLTKEQSTTTAKAESKPRREKLTPEERKARREAALKEARLAAKNVQKQNRFSRSNTMDDAKATQSTTKSKGLFGKLRKMSKSFDRSNVMPPKAASARSLQDKMEQMQHQQEEETTSTTTSSSSSIGKPRLAKSQSAAAVLSSVAATATATAATPRVPTNSTIVCCKAKESPTAVEC